MQHNINQSETRIGDQKSSVELWEKEMVALSRDMTVADTVMETIKKS